MKCPQRTKAVSAARPLERGFDRIHPGVDEKLKTLPGDYIAANDRHCRAGFDPGDHVTLKGGMPVRGVNDQDVDVELQ